MLENGQAYLILVLSRFQVFLRVYRISLGTAEASAIKSKAIAMQEYGREAVLSSVFEALPGLASEIAAPLSNIDKIVLFSNESSRSVNRKPKKYQRAQPLTPLQKDNRRLYSA